MTASRTARTGELGDRSAGTGSRDSTAGIGQLERTAGTGQPR